MRKIEYVVGNGDQYIKNSTNGLSLVPKAMATRYSKDKAQNILKSLPKRWKKFHMKIHIVPGEVEIIKYEELSIGDEVKTFFEEAQGLSNKLKERLEQLSRDQSEIDKAKVDIEHKIEFSEKVSACDGWKYFALLKDVLVKRRKIKDDIAYISYILGSTIKECGEGKQLNFINGMENRQYRARVLEELFEGNE